VEVVVVAQYCENEAVQIYTTINGALQAAASLVPQHEEQCSC
jgi:hypothetical protein